MTCAYWLAMMTVTLQKGKSQEHDTILFTIYMHGAKGRPTDRSFNKNFFTVSIGTLKHST